MNSTEVRNMDGAGDGRGLDPYKLHDDVLRVMSDTPRTDAAALGFARLMIDHEKYTTTELVDANFARQLERELADAQQRIREWRDLCEKHDAVTQSELSVAKHALIEQCAQIVDDADEQSETGDALAMCAAAIRALKG